METAYITDPVHGGKVTCHKCGGFIDESEVFVFPTLHHLKNNIYFHESCFNRYEHYYGLGKPID